MQENIRKNKEFLRAIPVLTEIEKAGFEAYFVGGSVRDHILGLDVNDVDIATSAHPNEIKSIFRRTVDLGIEHGTILVLYENRQYEITTFRTESTYKDFRRPDSVTFVRSLLEDLKRRDFTMNAIAMDVDGCISDPFDGMKDINHSLIRAVGIADERFNEDALRMMRAVRFAGQLGFKIDRDTFKSVKTHAALLDNIAIERIQVEFEKLLISKWRSEGLNYFIEAKLFSYCPKLKNKEKDLRKLSDIKSRFKSKEEAWAMLVYLLEKENYSDSFSSKDFLKSWKLSNQLIKDSIQLSNTLRKRLDQSELDSWTIFKLGLEQSLIVEQMVIHFNQKSNQNKIKETYKNLPIKRNSELAVSGTDLIKISNEKPGKWLGIALDTALKKVVEGEVNNTKDEIISYLISKDFINIK